ncbi:hypothetical protein TNCT_310031 [Trichonephila clavata]|uniref:Uncharacterized protein n=1 Tax=Trichonephila clavata TaxID=2740835 RepID=A0A8X6FTA8_TRICU|nr:hypothetical protein TNCT_310031 [Trichonephila clavata]
MEVGPNSYEMSLEIDKQRIKLADRSLNYRGKEARINSRSSRKEMLEQDNNLEGQLLNTCEIIGITVKELTSYLRICLIENSGIV